ncbi:hypothetical protein PV797_01575 [Clostridiaceae bacterium M8S5]|nr:hypothetical protein PV797_01575 [Clostridiaceae bacterium M8S5]
MKKRNLLIILIAVTLIGTACSKDKTDDKNKTDDNAKESSLEQPVKEANPEPKKDITPSVLELINAGAMPEEVFKVIDENLEKANIDASFVHLHNYLVDHILGVGMSLTEDNHKMLILDLFPESFDITKLENLKGDDLKNTVLKELDNNGFKPDKDQKNLIVINYDKLKKYNKYLSSKFEEVQKKIGAQKEYKVK